MNQRHVTGRRILNDRICRVVIPGLAALLVLSVQSDCSACLFNWLFGKKQTQTAYYATTAAATAPTTTTAASPQQGCCGTGYCEQTVLRYSPQVAYRTVWQPVPVTTYKRTVSYNPTTGLPITCTQPCTTYTYQARRVPYTTYRPYYATEPVTIPGNCPTSASPAASPVVTQSPASCGCATGATPGASDVPYYSTPSATTPSTSTPSGATPWTRVQPGEGASPYSVPSPTPATGDPADERPRIRPEIEPDLGSSSIQRAPVANDRTALSSDSVTSRIDRFYRHSGVSPSAKSSSSLSREDSRWRSDSVSDESGFDSFNAPSNQRDASSINEAASDASRSSRPGSIRPLPNLDFDSRDRVPNPRLLNDAPQDRTASFIQPIPTRWNSNRINWERRVSYQASSQERSRTDDSIRRLETRRFESSDRSVNSGWTLVGRDDDRNRVPRRSRSTANRTSVGRSDEPRVNLGASDTQLYRFNSESNESRPATSNGWRSMAGQSR